MCDGAKAVTPNGINQNSLLLQRGNDCRGREAVTDHIEDDDIGFYIVWVDPDRGNLLECSCQLLGMVVVRFQPPDMVLEGIDAGGCEDAGLPHRAAIHATQPFGLIEKSQIIHHQQRADGRPQPFREAH